MSTRERRASGSTVPRVEDSVSVLRSSSRLPSSRSSRVCGERQGISRLDTVHAYFSTWFYLTFFFFSMCVHDTYTGTRTPERRSTDECVCGHHRARAQP